MERYYVLTDKELMDLTSRRKSVAGLKLLNIEIIPDKKRVYVSKETMSEISGMISMFRGE